MGDRAGTDDAYPYFGSLSGLVVTFVTVDGGPALADKTAPGFPGWPARDKKNLRRAHPELAAQYALAERGPEQGEGFSLTDLLQ